MKFSLLTANFNNKELTNSMIMSFRKQYGMCHAYVLDNSTEQKYETALNDVTIIDNFNYKNTTEVYEHAVTKYDKLGGRYSVLHSGTIEYAFNLIDDEYIVLCDNDVMFYPSIQKLLNEFDENEYDVIAETGIAEWGWPTERLFPFFCLINLKKVKQYHIHFYTPDSIIPGEKDTGAFFLEELNKNNIKIKNIKLTDYIVHLGQGSWLNKDTNYFLKQTKKLRPMINVVFTTYYKNNNLSETFYSIFNQSYKDWQLIVIDLSKEKYFENWFNDFQKESSFENIEHLISDIKIINFSETDNYNDYIKSLSCYDNDFVVFLKDNDIVADYLFENIYDINSLYPRTEMISSDYIPILFNNNEIPCINTNLPKNSVNIKNHDKVIIGKYFFSLYNGFPQLRNFHKWKSHDSIIIIKKSTILNNRFSLFYNNTYNNFSFCTTSVFLQEVYILDVCFYKIIYNNSEQYKTYKYCAEMEAYLNDTNFKKNKIYYTPKNRNYIV